MITELLITRFPDANVTCEEVRRTIQRVRSKENPREPTSIEQAHDLLLANDYCR
jgi:hypothetical protein